MGTVGIEGSGNFGRAVAAHLAISWNPDREVSVVEVPTGITPRERRARLGRGKSDPVDALAIARITAREKNRPPVRLAVGPAADLRALFDYREDPGRRTDRIDQPGPCRPIWPATGLPPRDPDLTSAARIRALLDMLAGEASIRAEMCRRRLERVIDIDAEAAAMKRQVAALVAASAPP